MTQISILGCGWLGLPLAKVLIKREYKIKGSTTSEDKIAILQSNSIIPFLISLYADRIQGKIVDFLAASTILIIDIPPKLRGEHKEDFTAKIRQLIPYIEQSNVEKVLFISSTSVYANDNSIITENTIPLPETNSGKQLLIAEQLLQDNFYFKTTILRFSGLIDEDRHPIKFLAGRKNIENPNSAINLVHQKDCIGIILKIIEKDCWNEIFNASSPAHPERALYYTQKANDLGLPPPLFNYEKPSFGKIIISRKIETILEYHFEVLEL